MFTLMDFFCLSDKVGGYLGIILNVFLIVSINKTTKGPYVYLVLLPAINDLIAAINTCYLQHVRVDFILLR